MIAGRLAPFRGGHRISMRLLWRRVPRCAARAGAGAGNVCCWGSRRAGPG